MKTDMSFILSVDTDDMEELKKELSQIDVKELFEDIGMIYDENGNELFAKDDRAVEKITLEKPHDGFLTALAIAIISKLVIEVIKKTPKAIKALKKLIKKILEKSHEKSKGKETPVFELYYRGLVLKFTDPSDEHIDKVLKRLVPAL